MTTGYDTRWLTLAGDFPSTLNKEARETELEPNESPDAWGMDLDTPGLLAAISTEPTGTVRVLDSQSVSGLGGEDLGDGTMYWIYNRLWDIDETNSNHLRFGSPDYRDTYVAQRNGIMPFTESTTAIIWFVEAGNGGMVVAKSDGSFFIPNAADRAGKFQKLAMHQAFICSNVGSINTLEGVAYVVNANGVFAFDGTKTVELTANIRNDLDPFDDTTPVPNALLTIDYDKKWLIGGTTEWAIDLNNGKLFDYSQSGFRWTSRAFRGKEHEPFSVDRVALMVDHGNTAGGEFTYQIRTEENAWSDEQTMQIDYEPGEYSRFEFSVGDGRETCRKWQIRITSLDANIRIKEVQINATLMEAQDYSE